MVKLEEANKVIMLPFSRNAKIENAVNVSNVAFKDVEEVDEYNIHDGYLNISHEVNNLISNIHGESQIIKLLIQNFKTLDKIPLLRIIGSINQNCLKLTKSFNNIIEIQRIKENRMCLYFNNVNVVEIIEDIVINVSKNIKNKRIIFDTNIEEKFMPCDIEKIQRTILILLSNAVRFSSEKEVFVNLNIDNNITINISFRNNNSNLLSFFIDSMDNLKVNSLEDLSIGFYLCKSIIELHEGSIGIVGNEDEICFSIQMPYKNTDSIYYLFSKCKIFDKANLTELIQIEFSDLYDLDEQ